MMRGVQQLLLLLFVWSAAGSRMAFADTNPQDVAALRSMMKKWKKFPSSWGKSNDPCRAEWDGILCDANGRVTSLNLFGMGMSGTLSDDVGNLTELRILDLSSNSLDGPLPAAIGKLVKLEYLALIGCGFTGPVPSELGNLSELIFFIPPSLGKLSNVTWLDLADNLLTGSLPNSRDNGTGLDQLLNAEHFHFNRNMLEGSIPESLFNSNMSLKHILFDINRFTGQIPASIGVIPSLEVLRLNDNGFTGPVPALKSPTKLQVLDLSNNSFDPSNVPSWFSDLKSIMTLTMKSVGLSGQLPQMLFSFPDLQQLVLSDNELNGTLDMGNNISTNLNVVDVQNNKISSVTVYNSFNVEDLNCTPNQMVLVPSNEGEYLTVAIKACPVNKKKFNYSQVLNCFNLTRQTYNPPEMFGPYYVQADPYPFQDKTSRAVLIGIVTGSVLLILGLTLVGFYAVRQKKRAQRLVSINDPFASWGTMGEDIGEAPKLKSARFFTLEELKLCTNYFREINVIGAGGYGRVYRGKLLDGQLVAIKRSKEGSMQGMKGIQLDWSRRLRIALDSARGLAYLHDHASPPIIHRDVKSTNILLDEKMTAKGYLDPEYYMTQQLTAKSDVYSFGVVLLELIVAKPPIHDNKYIVREVKMALDMEDRTHCGLKDLMDPVLVEMGALLAFPRFLKLALQCVEEVASSRPSMNSIVREIEGIMLDNGLTPGSMSSSSSFSVEHKMMKVGPKLPYSNASTSSSTTFDMDSRAFEYSGAFPSSHGSLKP
nr:unnamed protein product [Digitaria exilis]